MTPAEQKIYDAVNDMAIKQAVFNNKFETLEKTVAVHNTHIETLKSDRNKVIGVSWVGGFFITIGGIILEWFHKTT